VCGSYIPGLSADADTHTGLDVCAQAHTGSHAGPFACGPPFDKILLGGGDGLISTSFPNIYWEAQYVNISLLIILATQSLPLSGVELKRRVPNIQTWPLFKSFFTEAHRDNSMISQTALRFGYHTANMVTQVPAVQFETCDVVRYYAHPNDVQDSPPNMTTALANVATATGADWATVYALTKSLADLTSVTKAQAEELRCLVHSGHIAPMPAPAQHSSATAFRRNGRQRRTGNNEQVNGGQPLYKSKNNN
jgi:hypothetical protein